MFFHTLKRTHTHINAPFHIITGVPWRRQTVHVAMDSSCLPALYNYVEYHDIVLEQNKVE